MDTVSCISATESYLNHFIKDGVIVFRQLLNAQQLQIIINEVKRVRSVIIAKIATMERPLKTYSDIAEREPGRLDYRCGFTSAIFDQLAKPIADKVQQFSPYINFRYYWGAIPSLGGSGPTPMHRDVYPLLNTAKDNDLDFLDLNLPSYYFTVLIPLVEITEKNGRTQFIKGSHRELSVDEENADKYSPSLSPGDIVIFDGRTLHRGLANHTTEERVVAYLTFVADWYYDQTFTINDYLFPELAIKGR